MTYVRAAARVFLGQLFQIMLVFACAWLLAIAVVLPVFLFERCL